MKTFTWIGLSGVNEMNTEWLININLNKCYELIRAGGNEWGKSRVDSSSPWRGNKMKIGGKYASFFPHMKQCTEKNYIILCTGNVICLQWNILVLQNDELTTNNKLWYACKWSISLFYWMTRREPSWRSLLSESGLKRKKGKPAAAMEGRAKRVYVYV